MSIAATQVSDSDSNSPEEEESTKTEATELLELTGEVFIIAGVASPLFLIVIALALQTTGRGSLLMKGIPFITFVTCLIESWIMVRVSSSLSFTEDDKDNRRMAQVILFLSSCVLIFIVGVLQIKLVPELEQFMTTPIIAEPYLSATIGAVTLPTGFIIGYLQNRSMIFGFISSVLTTVIFGWIYFVAITTI